MYFFLLSSTTSMLLLFRHFTPIVLRATARSLYGLHLGIAMIADCRPKHAIRAATLRWAFRA
jgi:hypothetical protein